MILIYFTVYIKNAQNQYKYIIIDYNIISTRIYKTCLLLYFNIIYIYHTNFLFKLQLFEFIISIYIYTFILLINKIYYFKIYIVIKLFKIINI